MSEQKISINRRSFLQLAAVTSVTANLPGEMLKSGFFSPEEVIALASPALSVAINTKTGVPTGYRLTGKNLELAGSDPKSSIEVLLCRKEPWSVHASPATVVGMRKEAGAVLFEFSVQGGSQQAATFSLWYRIEQSRVTVELDGIKELSGYELLEVRLPALVTVPRQMDGWMAHGDTGGALIELAKAKPGTLASNQFWGDILSTLPVLMAGNSKIFCLMTIPAFMCGGAMSVSPSGAGSMGVVLRHRVDGSQCADLNLGKGEPLNCGNESTPNLLVEQQAICRLEFFPIAGDWRQAWLVGAHHIRKQLPPKRTSMYDDVFTYGIRLDEPTWPEPATTFEQCEEMIREIAALTDHTPQIVHLWGWQFKGKDTGYPAVNEVDERIGGYNGMMRLMENAKKYNVTVTLSDNYDDGYRSSPAWSEDIVARRPDGELYNSRSWTGEKSYILGLAKYVRHGALERVDYTCKRYRLPKTTHIDVLTYYAVRNDWDRKYPASGYKNLVEGKYRILDAYHQRGVDVSSEAPRYPFMGKVSFYWQGCGIRPCPIGGQAIPLFPAVYRQAAVWGDGMHRGEQHPGAQQVFYGGGPRFMTRYSEDRMTVAETFYLQAVPWMLLHRRNILSFIQEQDQSRITIDDGEIRVSLNTGKYSVTINGVEVATDNWIAAPFGADRVLCYSVDARVLRVPMPKTWNRQQIEARVLTNGEVRSAPVSVEGDQFSISLAARTPVIVHRKSA